MKYLVNVFWIRVMRWVFIYLCRFAIRISNAKNAEKWLDVKNKIFESIYSILTSWVNVLINVNANFLFECFVKYFSHIFALRESLSFSRDSFASAILYKKISLIDYNIIEMIEAMIAKRSNNHRREFNNDVKLLNNKWDRLQFFISCFVDWHRSYVWMYSHFESQSMFVFHLTQYFFNNLISRESCLVNLKAFDYCSFFIRILCFNWELIVRHASTLF